MLFELFVALDYSEPPPFLGTLVDELDDLDDLDDLEPVEQPRLRKVGGIIGWLTDEFTKIEAAFMDTISTCAVCGTAPRPDGRMVCDPCRQAMRPPPMTPAEKEARRLLALTVARSKAARKAV